MLFRQLKLSLTLCFTLLTVFGSHAAIAGELVVYTALEDDEVAVYRKDFEAKYPDIDLQLVRDSTGIITARLLAEKDNPVADVVWGTAATSLLIADDLGMLAPYSPKGNEQVKVGMKDPNNAVLHWVGIKAWVTGIVGNTIEMQKLGLKMPQSYANLLRPEYAGLLVMPNPASSGTGFLTVSAVLQLMGEEAGWDYLDNLHKNIAQYTHSGSKPAKMAGKGEFPIGLSFAYRGFKQRSSGEPVEIAFPKEGSGYDVEANALIKKPRIKPEAKTFLDWAISEDAMKMYAKVYPIVATDIPVAAPQGWPADPASVLIDNDLMWAAKNRQRILDEWTKRYDGKSAPR
ncbi:putative 2-aminoethylphosphonate ABC transporter substrate-binding protein [Desulfuromusa kysingii]|uniref:putative 2-aminoethylphosphonate ABC transporter substrate-binding protein n=1 Tax=Desulfuromusa kysingii TaxID=37625 RepID=UPI000B8124A4